MAVRLITHRCLIVCLAALVSSCARKPAPGVPPPPGIILPSAAKAKVTEAPGQVRTVAPGAPTSPKPPAAALVKKLAPGQRASKSAEGKRVIPTYSYEVIVPRDPKTGAPLTDEQGAWIDEEVAKIEGSDLLFLCPTEMKLGIAEKVSFSMKENVDLMLKRALQSKGMRAERAANISTNIEAVLIPEKEGVFETTLIQESSGESLRVWSVTPRQLGRHRLNLQVTLTVTESGVTHEKVLPVLTQNVVVRQAAADAFERFLNSPWRWSMLTAPILAALLVWIRHRHRMAG